MSEVWIDKPHEVSQDEEANEREDRSYVLSRGRVSTDLLRAVWTEQSRACAVCKK